jgi:hypothetical protein
MSRITNQQVPLTGRVEISITKLQIFERSYFLNCILLARCDLPPTAVHAVHGKEGLR